MKKPIKILTFSFLFILILLVFLFSYFLIIVKDYKLDDKNLTITTQNFTFFDDDGNKISNYYSRENVAQFIPNQVKNAFISVEDKRFYSHSGIDVKRIIGATLNNLKSLSFKEGGSTISQQLIKNTHLTSKKTLKSRL